MKKALLIGSLLLVSSVGMTTPALARNNGNNGNNGNDGGGGGGQTAASCQSGSVLLGTASYDDCFGAENENDTGAQGTLLDNLNGGVFDGITGSGGEWFIFGKSDEDTEVDADEGSNSGAFSVDFSDLDHDVDSIVVSLKAADFYSAYLFDGAGFDSDDSDLAKQFAGTFDTFGVTKKGADLSHLTIAYLKRDDNGGGPTPVPEPAAMAGLLAVGAGIVINRRKK